MHAVTDNSIGADGAAALASALGRLVNLTELGLEGMFDCDCLLLLITVLTVHDVDLHTWYDAVCDVTVM